VASRFLKTDHFEPLEPCEIHWNTRKYMTKVTLTIDECRDGTQARCYGVVHEDFD
jgi:hypothetical protein